MQNTITYLKWLELQNYKERSIQTLISLQKQVENYLYREGFYFSTESLKSFSDWTANQGYSAVYQQQLQWGVLTYLSYLKQVQGLKIKVYLPKIKRQRNRRKALSKEQLNSIEKWLQEVSKDYCLHQLLWSLFYGCGLRRTEAINLQLKDINIKDKLLHIKTLKSGGKRSLPLSKTQVQSLVNYLEKERPKAKEGFENYLLVGKRGGKMDGTLASCLRQWQDGTGLGMVLCWHILRHSIATNLVQSGLPIEQVSRFLGHKNIGSTAIYLHYQKKENEL
jgi:integrase/recombinase XerD